MIFVFGASSTLAEDPKPKAEKKPPSVCVGLDINACGAKSECYWKQQITTKAGKVRKAHCRKKWQGFAKKGAAT